MMLALAACSIEQAVSLQEESAALFCRQGILCTTCRHYGGTKLGTGGLARAYGGAARECLRLAEKVMFQRQATLCMQVTQDTPRCLYMHSVQPFVGWF